MNLNIWRICKTQQNCKT